MLQITHSMLNFFFAIITWLLANLNANCKKDVLLYANTINEIREELIKSLPNSMIFDIVWSVLKALPELNI